MYTIIGYMKKRILLTLLLLFLFILILKLNHQGKVISDLSDLVDDKSTTQLITAPAQQLQVAPVPVPPTFYIAYITNGGQDSVNLIKYDGTVTNLAPLDTINSNTVYDQFIDVDLDRDNSNNPYALYLRRFGNPPFQWELRLKQFFSPTLEILPPPNGVLPGQSRVFLDVEGPNNDKYVVVSTNSGLDFTHKGSSGTWDPWTSISGSSPLGLRVDSLGNAYILAYGINDIHLITIDPSGSFGTTFIDTNIANFGTMSGGIILEPDIAITGNFYHIVYSKAIHYGTYISAEYYYVNNLAGSISLPVLFMSYTIPVTPGTLSGTFYMRNRAVALPGFNTIIDVFSMKNDIGSTPIINELKATVLAGILPSFLVSNSPFIANYKTAGSYPTLVIPYRASNQNQIRLILIDDIVTQTVTSDTLIASVGGSLILGSFDVT